MKNLIKKLDALTEEKTRGADRANMVLGGIRQNSSKSFIKRAEKYLSRSDDKSDEIRKGAEDHLKLIDKIFLDAFNSLVAPTASYANRFRKQLKKYAGGDVKESVDNDGIDEALWSGAVTTKWSPPEGFFKQSASKIAAGLKSASDDLQQAIARLNFYRNRAGKNLSQEDKDKLQKALELLQKAYKK